MKIYDYFRSSAAYRVRIALNIKGLDPARDFIHLRHGDQHQGDYLAVNPQGLVPALVDGDGETHTQSLAIIEYLDEMHPEPPLLPADPTGRSRVRSLAFSIGCDLHPLNNMRVLKHLEERFGLTSEQVANDWYLHWINIGFLALERRLVAETSTGRFCHGDRLTLADCCLVPQVFNATRYAADMSSFPVIQRIYDACMAESAVSSAQPSAQPDAE